MEIKFDVFWTKNLGTIYKDNSVDIDGKEAVVDLDLTQVNHIYVNFKVGDKSYIDTVIVKDIDKKIVVVPFKTDVLKQGLNQFELVATMKNGDVLPSQTYQYDIAKSLEDENALQSDTNYPILINLINSVDTSIAKIDEAIAKIPPKSELIGPQGIQGPTGSASVAINDNVTNTETTWSSSKIANKTDILSSRLSDVETLKTSQNMKYSTDAGYVVCSDTKEGMIDNLSLQGKTLVNLNITGNATNQSTSNYYIDTKICSLSSLDSNKKYTFIAYLDKQEGAIASYNSFEFGTGDTGYSQVVSTSSGTKITWDNKIKIGTFSISNTNNYKNLWWRPCRRNTAPVEGESITYSVRLMILEGDHTQNPPSYFEGIASVGTGLDKIEVLSRKEDGNLFDGELEIGSMNSSTGENVGYADYVRTRNYIQIIPNSKIFASLYAEGVKSYFEVYEYDNSKKYIKKTQTTSTGLTVSANTKYIKCTKYVIKFNMDLSLISHVSISKNQDNLDPYQADKKAILYYDSTNKILPVTALRRVSATCYDEIIEQGEKHYFKQNCDRIVYNGTTETGWTLNDSTFASVLLFAIPRTTSIANSKVVCDKFNNVSAKGDYEGIFIDANNVYVGILKTKCTDLATYKTWLTTNNITAVFELNTKLIYECVNLDLDSYASKTMISCSSIVPPGMSFEITSHIGNTIQVLKERISTTEDKVIYIFKQLLAGGMQSLAYELYPEDFATNEQSALEEPII